MRFSIMATCERWRSVMVDVAILPHFIKADGAAILNSPPWGKDLKPGGALDHAQEGKMRAYIDIAEYRVPQNLAEFEDALDSVLSKAECLRYGAVFRDGHPFRNSLFHGEPIALPHLRKLSTHSYQTTFSLNLTNAPGLVDLVINHGAANYALLQIQVPNLSQLRCLCIRSHRLPENIMDILDSCTSLETLRLSTWGAELPELLGTVNLPLLRHLSMQDCRNAMPQFKIDCPKLEHLELPFPCGGFHSLASSISSVTSVWINCHFSWSAEVAPLENLLSSNPQITRLALCGLQNEDLVAARWLAYFLRIPDVLPNLTHVETNVWESELRLLMAARRDVTYHVSAYPGLPKLSPRVQLVDPSRFPPMNEHWEDWTNKAEEWWY